MQTIIQATFFFLALTTTLSARINRCAERRFPPKGEIEFPETEEEESVCDESYKWWFRLSKKQSIKLSFSHVQLRHSSVQINVKRYAREKYRTIQTVNASNHDMTVPVKPPYKFIQILRDGVDGSFHIDYEAFYCPLPTKMLTKGICTNSGYRKYSVCHFHCRAPDFYPIHPDCLNIVAKCRGNQRWSTDLTNKCVTLQQFEDMCFKRRQSCPFNHDQLNILFSPQNLNYTISEEEHAEHSHIMIEKESVQNTTSMSNKCSAACARHPGTSTFIHDCSTHPSKWLLRPKLNTFPTKSIESPGFQFLATYKYLG
ncbi:uncharacterized protein LOC100186309 [Ciona intestinalis]